MEYPHFHFRNLVRKHWWQGNSLHWYLLVISSVLCGIVFTAMPTKEGLIATAILLPLLAFYAARKHVATHGHRNIEDNTRLIGVSLVMALGLLLGLCDNKPVVTLTAFERALTACVGVLFVLFLKNMMTGLIAHKAYYKTEIQQIIAKYKNKS